ncbi:MAG: hypothetical protein KAV00_15040 [Phycisphaerae bacterium]|nr:hypothetical protein [Phycisphaerae bacterium]
MRKADAEARVNAANRRVGEFLQALTQGRGASGILEGRVTRVTVMMPSEDRPEALLVVKATGDLGDRVAFVGGLDVVQAILVWAAKDSSKGLKWREDLPWSERKG